MAAQCNLSKSQVCSEGLGLPERSGEYRKEKPLLQTRSKASDEVARARAAPLWWDRNSWERHSPSASIAC